MGMRGADVRAFVLRIRARDRFACRRCGVKDPGAPCGLHVHHIRPWARDHRMRFDELNVVTLCRSCHLWVHGKANVHGEWLG
jgi:5-methylcytosine-specific restriction endonuclease McrA